MRRPGDSRGRGVPEAAPFSRRGRINLPLMLLANAAAPDPAGNAAPARVPLSKQARHTWRACVLARYHEMPSNCYQCQPPTVCMRYFCASCKVGVLCDKEFNNGALHHSHDRLQIYNINGLGLLSVRTTDLPMNLAGTTAEVAEFFHMWNMYYLRTRSPALRLRPPALRPRPRAVRGARHPAMKKLPTVIPVPQIWCEGCNYFVSNVGNDALQLQNEQAAKVCSIECLVKYDQRQHAFHHQRRQSHPKRSQALSISLHDIQPLEAASPPTRQDSKVGATMAPTSEKVATIASPMAAPRDEPIASEIVAPISASNVAPIGLQISLRVQVAETDTPHDLEHFEADYVSTADIFTMGGLPLPTLKDLGFKDRLY